MYHEEVFDELFDFKLEALEKLRNKLMHFEAEINKTDFILLKFLYKKCIDIFNQELRNSNFKMMCKYNIEQYYRNDLELYTVCNDISSKIIESEILNDEAYKLILGVIIDNSSDMIEMEPTEYERFSETCFIARKSEFKILFNDKNEKDIKGIIIQKIYTLLAANIICYEGIPVDDYGTCFLSRTELTSFALHIIKSKWRDDKTIQQELKIGSMVTIHKDNDIDWDLLY